MNRLAITITGIVQGVGFRPFVHDAALEGDLAGWVSNDTGGVQIEVEGEAAALDVFVARLRRPPAAARVDRIDTCALAPSGERGFTIRESTRGVRARAVLPADLAVCDACVREMDSPAQRRFRYPFTNCAHCGPRLTIVESAPYDRARTAMRGFEMCAACAREYGDPGDRRFHAQPIACPACGPRLEYADVAGVPLALGEAALQQALQALRNGAIVALKGLGGYQLICNAADDAGVRRLRQRKRRPHKPFAVMFSSLDAVRAACELDDEAAQALMSSAAPIVLLRSLPTTVLSPSVAPGNPLVGAMLPVSPLHRLLVADVGYPLVCTSGNPAGEPMCTVDDEAVARLGTVADAFLRHDRPVLRPVDDSVARVGPTGLSLLRRARGYAPVPLPMPGSACVLALGGQSKNTVTLAFGDQAVTSAHGGDLSSAAGGDHCERAALDLVRFFDARVQSVACDLHPDYASTRMAESIATRWQVPVVRVQHHHAHVAAVVAETGLQGPVLGLAWDGAGLGTDGWIWGGEALVVDGARWHHAARLRPFSLPGGEAAMREPRRAAAGLLHEAFGASFGGQLGAAEPADALLATMLERRVNCPRTTSMGRLFDAVAALTGVCTRSTFEGEAAMRLEHAAGDDKAAYPLPLVPGEPAEADWLPLLHALLRDRAHGVPVAAMAARLHNALVDLAQALAEFAGLPRVVLCGGCFQNQRLAATVHARLVGRGFAVHLPRLYPPNDGGLSLGQALVARLMEDGDVPRCAR